MGILISDHRSTVDPTGTKDGKLEEWDTVSCPHCQAVIKIKVLGPSRKKIDSPGECDFCKRPICHACAARLAVTEVCPGEMRANIRRALERRRAGDRIYSIMGAK